ncbi:hypothetical protein [Agromyces sp. M3QZ16-3]|uniref:hypothetical protein n=1 Tax=Agromyces sp. M3QZ16-3 TaxID=3447585 RepID=UPI003F68D19F
MTNTGRRHLHLHLLVAAIGGVLMLGGCTASPGAAQTGASEAAPPPASDEPSNGNPQPGDRVLGLPQSPDYPISFTVPTGATAVAEGGGTWAFVVEGTSAGVAVHDVRTLADVPAADLPDDIASFIASERSDVTVSDAAAIELDGVPAQSFTLQQVDGVEPRDLWCVTGGTCFKLLPDKPMDVITAPTDAGRLWVSVEYLPEDAEVVEQHAAELLDSFDIGPSTS